LKTVHNNEYYDRSNQDAVLEEISIHLMIDCACLKSPRILPQASRRHSPIRKQF
jgi:hypothetical protein